MNRIAIALSIATAFAAGCGVTHLLRPALAADTIAALDQGGLIPGLQFRAANGGYGYSPSTAYTSRASASYVTGKNDAKEPVFVAWIEDGKPDLEFDGRMARPRPGSTYGLVKRGSRDGRVAIHLNRKLAA